MSARSANASFDKVAVLASGGGTLLDAILSDGIPVALVVTDRPCAATDVAARHGVESVVHERGDFSKAFDRDAYTAEVAELLRDAGIDLIVMAGYGTVFGQAIHDAFPFRILNTHPALLPAFKGWHAVPQALEYGVKVTGCTVHVATLEVDAGPILAQEAVDVLDDDTVDSLHERIKEVERRLYPKTIRAVLADPSLLDRTRPETTGEPPRMTAVTHKTAFLSVYDKAGVAELAQGLVDAGWSLVSSGGTARAIADAGIPVTSTEEVTGYPAILGHRVATLHPKIHGAILADPTDAEHQADLETYEIEPFALVVANLYPFGDPDGAGDAGGRKLEAEVDGRSVDLIDIGGPAMVRAAAKNHAHVGIVVDPADYEPVLAEIRSDGSLGDATRRRLARKAFAHTAGYDAAVVSWFDETDPEPDPLPPTIHLALERDEQVLRYGENPHQEGARYRQRGVSSVWDQVEQHAGVALSYLNIFDADAAWNLAHDLEAEFGKPAVAIIKHANPCGAAVADSLALAYEAAFACDPRSAFGGIVATSHRIDPATVEEMVNAAQADVVIAPGYDDGVIEALVDKRKNTRLLTMPPPGPGPRAIRQLNDTWLVQSPHHFAAGPDEWRVVTERQPTEAELADAAFAWRVCGWVKSNSIVLAKDGTAWGIGAGQQNRVEAGEIAASKAAGRADGGACASDAFYPFPDGIEAAAEAGVAIIIQPGGSVRDEQNIERANELGVAMVFTGERHFLH